MEDLLAQPYLRWPSLPERYEKALQEAVEYILGRFQPVGLVAAGSILRGKPDLTSDLDLYVIHLAPFRQRIQKFFRGVPAEIFVNPPAAVLKYLEDEHRGGRPITAHMLTTGFVMLERGPTLSELRRTAAASLYKPLDSSSETVLYARYLVALRLEDALDVVKDDPATANMLLSQAVVDMLNFIFQRAGRYYPRGKDLLEAATRVDEGLGDLARQFFISTNLQQRVDLAGQIADRTVGARGFFEWESKPDEVK
jgi:hypothetical protein